MSEEQQAPELLPCPFCGGNSKIEEFRDGDDPQPLFVATCETCPVKTYDQFSAQEAARLWNVRADLSPVAKAPVAEEWLTCAKCGEKRTASTVESRATFVCRYCLHTEALSPEAATAKDIYESLPDCEWCGALCPNDAALLLQKISSALTSAQSKGVELQKEVDAKAICFMCAEPEKYQPPRDVEGFDKPCHFYTASHPVRPNCNAAECKATAIRAAK